MSPANPAPIPLSVLPQILEIDTTLYPTSTAHLSLSTLESWVSAAPSFSFIYPYGGIIIALPIKATIWKRLIDGEIDEWDVTAGDILGEHGDEEMGMHLWHIERAGEKSGFARRALRELGMRTKKRNISGWSALAVTDSGMGSVETLGWSKKSDREGGVMMVWNGMGPWEGWDKE